MNKYHLHPRVTGIVETPRIPVICTRCGKEFRAARRTAKYCSAACSQAAFRMRKQRL